MTDLSWTEPQVNPKRDWSRPELQAQVRRGTVIVMRDGGVCTVEEVVPEGVIVRDLSDPRDLLSWALLTNWECRIEGWVDLSKHVGRGAALRDMTGSSAGLRALTPAEWAALVEKPGDVGDALAMGVAAEMLRVCEADGVPVTLHAKVLWGPIRNLEVTLDEGGTPNPDGARDETLRRSLIWHHKAMEARQPMGWDTLSLTITRKGERWGYEMKLGYRGDSV